MCLYINTGVEQTLNKSQHTKLTLEEKILPPLLPEFKFVTFWSWVWHWLYQQVVPALQVITQVKPILSQQWESKQHAQTFTCRDRERGLCVRFYYFHYLGDKVIWLYTVEPDECQLVLIWKFIYWASELAVPEKVILVHKVRQTLPWFGRVEKRIFKSKTTENQVKSC